MYSHRPNSWPGLLFGGVLLCPACVGNDDAKAASTGPKPSVSAGASLATTTPKAVPSASTSSGMAGMEVSLDLERSCRRICERSQQLQCGNAAKCLPNCLAMGSATPCTTEMLGFFECLVGQPLQNWECAPDGVAAIRNGICESEQARTAACMQAKMR